MTSPAQLDPKMTTMCRCGDAEVFVDSEMMAGAYAVHLTVHKARASGPGYTVTHRPSGYAIWHVREFGAAVRIAQWLDENLKLPEKYEMVWQWKQQMSAVERGHLVGALTAIAPREWVIE